MKQFNCFWSSIGRSGYDLISCPSWLLRSETKYCGKSCQLTTAHKSCHYHSLHDESQASKSTFMHDHFVTSNSFVPQTSKWREALSDDRMAVPVPFFPSQSNHPFLKYLYLEIWPWKSQVKVMGSKVSSQMIADEQGKSTGVESSDRPSNLTQTGFKLSIFGQCDLEIRWMTSKNNRAPLLYYIKQCASFQSHLLIQTRVTVWECSLRVKIRDVFVPCDLEIWQMTLKNNRHLFCATSNFVHHFIAISVFKLELQSGNAQFGWKLMIFFCPVWPWNTIRHLLYATWSFVHYLGAISEFKLELTVQKCPIWVKIEGFFYAIWPWNLPSDLEKQ